MDNDFIPGIDPDEIKGFLHGLGLITLDEYYTQVKQMLKREKQSSRITNEHITENGIHKDDLSKNIPLLYPRKRTSFSPVITRKRGKAIKKRAPSATQEVITTTTTVITTTTTIIDDTESSTNTIDSDQPLDLRLQTKSNSKF